MREGPSTIASSGNGPPPHELRSRGGAKWRKVPRWVIPFLRALERCGEARAAAADAGVDHSTAYARRRAHAEFGDEWDAAAYRYAVAKEQREREEIDAVKKAPPPPSGWSPSPAKAGENVVLGGRVKRVGAGRWSQAKEKIFFETLAATNNITRSAAAAGVSYNAVLARRHKHRLFREKWDAVVHNAKAAIELYVVEQARKTFDPDELDTGEVTPKVTIAEAIKISQAAARKASREGEMPAWPDEAESMPPDEIEAVRERILNKLKRMKEREMPARLAAGWSYDESYELMIPPGWMKGPDYRPRDPEPPEDFD
jgi:hypothetical protein